MHELDAQARHLILLCRNEEGYRNLCHMVSKSFTEGFYIKPRVDKDLLREHHEGLIALSACLAGAIPRMLRAGDYEGAKREALEMRALFGEDGYYLRSRTTASQRTRRSPAVWPRLHEETGIPLVATNDAHYLTREDAATQDVLMCIQMGQDGGRPGPDEVRDRGILCEERGGDARPLPPVARGGGEHPAGGRTSARWSSSSAPITCRSSSSRRAPPTGTPTSRTVLEGFARRYPDQPPEYLEQLKYEMAMIRKMGFVDYFLIVSDFIGYAKRQQIPVGPGRGSAAGSMVSYCLDITDIDPLKYNLYFERSSTPSG